MKAEFVIDGFTELVEKSILLLERADGRGTDELLSEMRVDEGASSGVYPLQLS